MAQRGRQRGRQRDWMPFIFLARQLYYFGIDRVPPVTLFVGAINVAVHFLLADFSLYLVCLHPLAVSAGGYERLLYSAFFHADDWHLYHNMVSLLWKGTRLESQMGFIRFLLFTIISILGSGLLYTIISLALGEKQSNCAVGYSAVLFAYKVVLTFNSEGQSSLMGFPLPTKYLAWAELFYISYFFPNTSFLGHLCGILVGVIYMYGFLEPIFRVFDNLMPDLSNQYLQRNEMARQDQQGFGMGIREGIAEQFGFDPATQDAINGLMRGFR